MKILRSWLADYIESPLSDEDLANKLSLSGTSIESFNSGLPDGVVVAKITAINPHPKADRLQLATVTDGTEEMTVVCGAPNIAVGQIVPLAKIGTLLPGGKIERATIRGVESLGMLCAADELGLGEDHSGIMLLPDKYELGKPLNYYLGSETVFDVEVTPNRGDCLSHLGVAREVAAISDTVIKKSPLKVDTISQKASDLLTVDVKDKKLCTQYQARVIENVRIAESPEWLKNRLVALGAKPINNIVDVTNYIMLDLGQPLHAFDFSKTNKSIVVRRADKNETITTLDGELRTLSDKMLVIANDKLPMAIAGIMGGLGSEITDQTTTIVLEAAVFDRRNIRATSKSLGLSSEASYRFERGVDSSLVEYALNKASNLIAECSGGRILSGIVRELQPEENVTVELTYDKITQLLGVAIPKDKINHILKLLGFEISGDAVTVPSWRHDIALWQDLAEEVGRIYGYANVDAIAIQKTDKPNASAYYFYEYIKDILTQSGFTETYNYPFLSEEDAKTAGLRSSDLLEVANPIQPEIKYLRTSLLPNLQKVVAKNASFDQVFVFEIGNVFTKTTEEKMLAIAAAGKDAKKTIDEAMSTLAEKIGQKKIEVRELNRDEIARFKIRKPVVYVVEIPLAEVAKKFLKLNQPKLRVETKNVHYRPISKYPSVTRDLAFIVDKKIQADDLVESIYSISDLINRVELFDEFASDKLGIGKKNLAYHIYLQKMDKTMVDAEADEIIKSVVKKIEKTFDAKLRS